MAYTQGPPLIPTQEMYDISARMAQLSARLVVAEPHQINPLWLEYKGQRDRLGDIKAITAASQSPTHSAATNQAAVMRYGVSQKCTTIATDSSAMSRAAVPIETEGE